MRLTKQALPWSSPACVTSATKRSGHLTCIKKALTSEGFQVYDELLTKIDAEILRFQVLFQALMSPFSAET